MLLFKKRKKLCIFHLPTVVIKLREYKKEEAKVHIFPSSLDLLLSDATLFRSMSLLFACDPASPNDKSSFWNFIISLLAKAVQLSLYKMLSSSVIFHKCLTVVWRISLAARS